MLLFFFDTKLNQLSTIGVCKLASKLFNRICALFFLLLVLTFPHNSFAQLSSGSGDERIIVNAGSMKRQSSDNSIHLSGNVRIVFGNNSVSCDEAIVRQKTFEIEAKGRILFITPSAIIGGDRMIMNYKTKIGSIYNGVIKMDQVIFEGAVINKTGEKEYEAVAADYTACTTCPPAWGFSGSNIKAEMGGYAYIKNSFLKIVKVPVFWVPYLIVPLNSRRQSGLLFPGFGLTSKAGFTYHQSFFWAINESEDATISLRYFQRRGLNPLLNYRYVLTEDSRGEADLGYIQDKLLSEDTFLKDNGYQNKRINRWHLKYKHTYVLPHDFVHTADIKLASDLRYSRDFNREFLGWGDPALDNRISLTKNTESSHASVDSSVYINQIKENPLSDNRDAVHRFPEIRYSLTPQKIMNTPFLFNLDTRYNNFARDSYTFDDRKLSPNGFEPETDPAKLGVYNSETDLIRTGQRLDLQPRVSVPVALGPYIDLLPSIAYRETIYQFGSIDKKSAERRLARTDVSARTRFSKIYEGDSSNPEATKYRHEVVPEITHTSIPWVQRQSHPFFGPNDQESFFTSNTALTDNDNLQFDYHDRLYERNLVTFSLSNYLVRKRFEDGQAHYNQVALFRLSQSYDYFESIKKTDPRQPWSDISALLDVRLDNFETNSLVRYYPYQNVATTSSRIKATHGRGHYMQLDYSQDFVIKKGARVDIGNRTEDLIANAGVAFNHMLLEGGTTYSFVTHKFKNYGYAITVNPPGNCWTITFRQYRIDNEDVYSFNAAFLFDGKKATTLSGEQL